MCKFLVIFGYDLAGAGSRSYFFLKTGSASLKLCCLYVRGRGGDEGGGGDGWGRGGFGYECMYCIWSSWSNLIQLFRQRTNGAERSLHSWGGGGDSLHGVAGWGVVAQWKEISLPSFEVNARSSVCGLMLWRSIVELMCAKHELNKSVMDWTTTPTFLVHS